MRKQSGFTAIELLYLVGIVVVVAAFGGWVNNIVVLAHSSFSEITGMLVLRAIGIFVAPLGAILGFC